MNILTRYGQIETTDPETDLIGRFLHHYGEWAWDEACFVASVLPERARVLDGGAFLGTFGLGLAARRPLAKLCSVEAHPISAALLRRNLARHLPDTATVVEALIAPRDDLPRVLNSERGNLGGSAFRPGEAGEAPHCTMELACLAQDHGPFDLIKLDVEGMERCILDNAAAWLAPSDTMLWLECNETPESLALAELLLSFERPLFYFAFPSHNPSNWARTQEVIFPFAYEAGLLSTSRGTPGLSRTLRRHGCILHRIESTEALRLALWQTPRWGDRSWLEAKSLPSLAALAVRTIRAETFSEFLRPDWRQPPMPWERIRQLQADVAELRGRSG